MSFHAMSTAMEVSEGVDLSGKVAVVTGGSSGIGVETCRALAARGARVIMAVRNLAKAEAVVADIKQSTSNDNVEAMLMDLSSMMSIRSFARSFRSRGLPIHILICNAGIMACPLARTAQGYESQFATNHLGHFLLVNSLSDILVRSAPARVVIVSSIAHKRPMANGAGINWDDIHFNAEGVYHKWTAYSQSKSANILFAVELNKRLAPLGVTATALHPGGIMTGLQKDLTHEEMDALGWLNEDGTPRTGFKNVEQGASTSVWLAVAPGLEGRGGFYAEDCAEAGVSDAAFTPGSPPPRGVSSWAINEADAARLWTESEVMVGQSFPLEEVMGARSEGGVAAL